MNRTLLTLMLVLCSLASAQDGPTQYEVTFSVDMSQYEGSFGGAFVNGSFNSWCGSCNPLTDNGDGTWSATLSLEAGAIEYKYTLDGWNSQEGFEGGESCTTTIDGFILRTATIEGDTDIGTVCWNSCDTCESNESWPECGLIGVIDSLVVDYVAEFYLLGGSGPEFSGSAAFHVSGVNSSGETLYINLDDGAGCFGDNYGFASSVEVQTGAFELNMEINCEHIEEFALFVSNCAFSWPETPWDESPFDECNWASTDILFYSDIANSIFIESTSVSSSDSCLHAVTVSLSNVCGEGTAWDEALQQCVSLCEPESDSSVCGEGTVWDPFNQECIVAIPTDTDFDGCVAAGDLLNLLGTFGSCPPIPFSGPCQGQDHVTYQGYNYDIVAIGEQCWFAENLRVESYANGDLIASQLDSGEWGSTNLGAMDSGPIGKSYNWFAVIDDRGLCPELWHVAYDHEWIDLELFLGMDEAAVYEIGWRGSDQGSQLKSSNGWDNGGTNSAGFSAIPESHRQTGGGYVNDLALWWCVGNEASGLAISRNLNDDYQGVFRYSSQLLNDGLSVRCIKDQ